LLLGREVFYLDISWLVRWSMDSAAKMMVLDGYMLVWGVNFRDSAIAIAKRLSLWSVMQKTVIGVGMWKIQLISLMRFWNGIVSRNAW
jgi:hypothetical protein